MTFCRRAAGPCWVGLIAITFVLLSHARAVAAPPIDGQPPEYTVASGQPPTPEYTVASGRVPAPVNGQGGGRGPLDPLDSVPEKLALLMVGGLLLGLAAAVRRTT